MTEWHYQRSFKFWYTGADCNTILYLKKGSWVVEVGDSVYTTPDIGQSLDEGKIWAEAKKRLMS